MRASTIVGLILMSIGVILLLSETELNNGLDFLYFILVKAVGFFLAYFGYQMTKDYDIKSN